MRHRRYGHPRRFRARLWSAHEFAQFRMSAKICSAYFSNGEVLPPRSIGSQVPSSRKRCIHLIAELTPMSNCSAASRREPPASTKGMTCTLDSAGYGPIGQFSRRINALNSLTSRLLGIPIHSRRDVLYGRAPVGICLPGNPTGAQPVPPSARFEHPPTGSIEFHAGMSRSILISNVNFRRSAMVALVRPPWRNCARCC